jgi:hypothetical protein
LVALPADQFEYQDAYRAALVLKASQDEQSGSVVQDGDAEPSPEQRLTRVLELLEEHLRDDKPKIVQPSPASLKTVPTIPEVIDDSVADLARGAPADLQSTPFIDRRVLYRKKNCRQFGKNLPESFPAAFGFHRRFYQATPRR